jgi:hypothetical protein
VNAFLDLAERQISGPVKARHRATERRTEARANKPAEDPHIREWRAWRQQQVQDALTGPHGAEFAALLASLQGATRWQDIRTADPLSARCSADPDTRFLATRLINDRIAELRQAAGLAPFDDALPF